MKKEKSLDYYKVCDNLFNSKDLKTFIDMQYQAQVLNVLKQPGLISELEANVLKGILAYLESIPKVLKTGSEKYRKLVENKKQTKTAKVYV